MNIPATIYGKTVVEIGKKAFYGCAHVKEFIIPSTVKTIDEKAFEGCSSLISVVFEDPYGWKVEESYHGNTIPLTLTDPRQNAKYLKNTYYLHTWQRE